MDLIERITWNGKPLAYIIRAEMNPEKTTFLTPPELNFQVGFVVYPAGGEIARHVHRPLERHIVVFHIGRQRSCQEVCNRGHRAEGIGRRTGFPKDSGGHHDGNE